MSILTPKLGENIPLEEHRPPNAPAEHTAGTRPARVLATEIRVDEEHIPGMVKENTVWDVYNNEARKVDTELVKDWRDSLNFLLVFAAIFAAVLTAFIIESKKLLEQDPTDLLVDIVIIYLSSGGNLSTVPAERPHFEPTTTAVSINCLLFASLGASLIAALASVIALQWVNEYDAAITRGGSSPEDRATRRQFRFAGATSWKMGEIIAGLPLLLYSSVGLFWVGAILWIWSINHTVGYVVAGGAMIAFLFYASTTVLAAVYVSAPFHTPISRGIYWLFQPVTSAIVRLLSGIFRTCTPGFLLALLQKASTFFHRSTSRLHLDVKMSSISAFFPPHSTATQREDLAAAGHPWLRERALCWLACQLPVSVEAHHRVEMLVREVLSHSSSQPITPMFQDAPWAVILGTLAWPYMQKVLTGTLLENDYEGLVMLLRCSRLPGIWSVISRVEGYERNPRKYHYWDQRRFNEADLSDVVTDTPSNAALLLARDIPIPSTGSTREIRATVSLIRWRNLREIGGTYAWRDLFERIDQFSPEYLKACLDNYRQVVGCWSYIPDPLDGERGDHNAIFSSLVQQALTRVLTKEEVVGLAQAFEAWVTRSCSGFTEGFKPHTIIQRPLLYGLALRETNEWKEVHWAITLSVVRVVEIIPKAEQQQWMWSIIMMIWLGYTGIEWDQLIKENGGAIGMEALWPGVAMDWRKDTHKIPYIGEILRIISRLLPDAHEAGPIWLLGDEREKYNKLVQAIKAFDNLIDQDCAPDLHLSLIRLIRMELPRLGQHWASFPISQEDQAERLFRVRDPCLAIIGAYASKASSPVEMTMTEAYAREHSDALGIVKDILYQGISLADPAAIWKFRASVWSVDSTVSTRRLLTAAMQEPEQMSFLQLIFQHPVSCHDHTDGPHHILFHLFEAFPPSIRFPEGTVLLDSVDLSKEAFNPILALLTMPYGHNPFSLSLGASFNQDCIDRVREIGQSIKQEPACILALLTDISLQHVDQICRPKQAAFIIELVRQIFPSVGDDTSTLVLRRLASALTRLVAEMAQRLRGTTEDREVLVSKTKHICGLLQAKSSERLVLSSCHLTLLSCARASEWSQPALGWMGMHVEI